MFLFIKQRHCECLVFNPKASLLKENKILIALQKLLLYGFQSQISKTEFMSKGKFLCRNSRLEVFFKKLFLTHLFPVPFHYLLKTSENRKVALETNGLNTCISIKKRLRHSCFLINFEKFYILQNIPERLLLFVISLIFVMI